MSTHSHTTSDSPPHKRHIAFVADAVLPYNKGGKEKRLDELAKRLVSDSDEVHIYTMKWWDEPRKEVEHNGVHYHALCKLHPLYSGDRRSITEAILFGFATLKMLFVRFDVIDVDHMPLFPLISARLVTWLKGKKLHATWHEVWGREYWIEYMGGALGYIGHYMEQLSFRLPDVIIANSEHTKKKLKEAGVTKEIHSVPLGVDVAGIGALTPDQQTSDIFFVGRFLSHKHPDLLVRAVGIIRKSHRGVICNLVGDGPKKKALAGLIVEQGLEANVHILDNVTDDDHLYRLMKASKILVLPSTREGFGLVILEANAAGIPAITTQHKDNAAKDLIQEGVNGLVAEVDESDLANKILHVLEKPETFDPMRHVAEYDWKFVVEKLKSAYH